MSGTITQVGQGPIPSFGAPSRVQEMIARTNGVVEIPSTPLKTDKLAMFKSIVIGIGGTVLLGSIFIVLLPLLLVLVFLLLIIAAPIALPLVAIVQVKEKFID